VGTTSPSGKAWDTAFGEAASSWNNASPGLVHLSVVGVSPAPDPCITTDGIDTAQFAPDVCGVAFGSMTLAIARRITSGGGGFTIDGAIHFKQSVSWDVYSGALLPVVRDFRRVAVHELGHLLGLDHESIAPAIMAPTTSDLEVPQADDIAGINALYNLGCPVVQGVGPGTVNAAHALSDCFDTEDGLPLPNGGNPLTPCNSSNVAQVNALVDLFRVSLPSGGQISATLTTPPTGFNPVVQLLTSDLSTELGLGCANSGSPAQVSKTLGPGQYVVATRSFFAGGIGSYTLSLVPEPGQPSMLLSALAALAGLAWWRRPRRARSASTPRAAAPSPPAPGSGTEVT